MSAPLDLGGLGRSAHRQTCSWQAGGPDCLPRLSCSLTDVHKQPWESPGLCAASTQVVGSPHPSGLQPQRTEPLLGSTHHRSNTWDALEPYPDPWRGHSSTGTPAWQEAGAGAEGRQGVGMLAVRGGLPAACLLGLLHEPPPPQPLRLPALSSADEWCCVCWGARLLHCLVTSPLPAPAPTPPRLPGSQASLTHAEPLPAGLPLLLHLLPPGHHLLPLLPDLWEEREGSSGFGNPSPHGGRRCVEGPCKAGWPWSQGKALVHPRASSLGPAS